jgi:D-alanyl-D-alanine carboxypeptidase
MAVNGKLDESELTPIPGGRLRADAAAAWLAMRRHIGKEKNVWVCPTSPRTSYRSFADQQYFWNLYRSGRGALAATPGSSNHGWGIAVDMPAAAMQAEVRACGHQFGWGIRGGKLASDAPSEAWHCTYHPGVFKPPPAEPKHVHPYSFMNETEREARDVLIKQRRVARQAGGWDKVDPSHLKRAVQAKKDLRACAVKVRVAAKESGWDKNNRKARFDYINQLTGE